MSPLCIGCAKLSDAAAGFVRFAPPRADFPAKRCFRMGRYALGHSPTPLSDLLLRFKYAGYRAAGHGLRLLVRAGAAGIGRRYDLVVPVPLHRKRLRERGYNQSAWLARGISGGLAAQLDVHALVRVAHTPPQALATARQRDGLRDVFAARAPRVRTRTVLLVDDVCTTGATAADAIRVLLAAGASEVDLAVLLLAGKDELS